MTFQGKPVVGRRTGRLSCTHRYGCLQLPLAIVCHSWPMGVVGSSGQLNPTAPIGQEQRTAANGSCGQPPADARKTARLGVWQWLNLMSHMWPAGCRLPITGIEGKVNSWGLMPLLEEQTVLSLLWCSTTPNDPFCNGWICL